MAESPAFKVQREYENPPNISAEVPGEQEIRERMENGGERISYTEYHTTVQSGSQTIQRTISTATSEEITEEIFAVEEKAIEPKKSKIPQLKFKEAAEKVNKKNKEQNGKTQPRRSSIPKLITLKRASSFKEEMSNDEFDKIYDEIVDDKQKDIDDKILIVKIDDPVKIETKFEEIIHAYDSNDDNVNHTASLKLSKIPWRRKSSGGSKIGTLVEKVRSKNTAPSNFKDGGFKVSGTSITTKRFSRGNSVELSHNQTLNVVETTASENTNTEYVEDTVVTKTIEGRPVKTKVTLRGISRGISYGATDDVIDIKEFEIPSDSHETVKVEESEGGRKVIKETITRQSNKTGIPIKPERNRNISRDLNKRPSTLDDRDFVNREVVKHEVLQDGSSRTTITETSVREIPTKTEKMTRSISRTFSRDGKSVTVSPKMKEHTNEIIKTPVEEVTPKENGKSFTSRIPHLDKSKTDLKQEVLTNEDKIKVATPVFKQIPKTERHAKDTKIAAPITKTTHSYSKGSIKNIERSKSIEWRAADEIRTKSYVRSHSEHISKLDRRDKKITTTVIEKEEAQDVVSLQTQDPVTESKVADVINEQVDAQIINVIKESEAFNSTTNQPNVYVSSVSTETNKLSSIQKEIDDNNTLPVLNKDKTTENVPVLKGNVSRLITQISEKDSTDVSKTDTDLEEDVLKKKSVLSKIALFEGKEPDEITIKVKKCIISNKTPTLVSEEDTEGFGLEDDTAQPKVDSNASAEEINNEAINMVHIWKTQEQKIENNSVVHQNEHVKVLPEAINFIVTENAEINSNIEITSPQTEFSNEPESLKILPERLDFEYNENKIDVQENFDTNSGNRTPEVSVTLPAKIDFIPNESINSVVKYSPELIFTQKIDSQDTVRKPTVGKLNLDLWNKKVETNKQFLDKGKFVKTSNTLSDKTVTAIERPKDKSEEVATILPDKIDFAAKEEVLQEAVILPQTIESLTVNETIVSTEMNLSHAKQITLMPEKIDFVHDDKRIVAATANISVEEKQLEVATTLPVTLDLNANESLHSSIEYSQETVKIQSNEKTEVNRPKVGKLNLVLWNKQVEVNKQYVGKGKHFKSNQAQNKISKIVTAKSLYEKEMSEIENIPNLLPESIEITSERKEEELKISETVTYDIDQSETIIRQNESPAVLPENIAITLEGITDMPTILPGAIDFVANENQLSSEIQTGITEAIDIKVSEMKEATTKLSHKILTRETSEVEQVALLPISLDFIHQELQVRDGLETEKTRNERQSELATTSPAKLYLSPNRTEDVAIEHAVGKINIQDIEKRKEMKKPRVGKLDLSIWNKQVEVNKQLVSKGKYTETILPQDKLPKILPEKSIYKSDAAKVEALKLNSIGQDKKVTSLPAKIDITPETDTNEVIQILPERIDFTVQEGQLTVPIDRPDTPLGKAGEIDFNSQKSEIIIPGTNEPEYNDNTTDTPIVITAKFESSIVDSPKNLLEQVSIESEHNQNSITENSSENIDNNSTEGEYEIDENEREIASDPELVDSEPEIGETKLNIMSRFNNKLFAPTHRHAANYIAVRTNQERSYSSISAPAEDFTARNDLADQNTTMTRDKQYASTENDINVHEGISQYDNFGVETSGLYGKGYRTRMKSYSIVEKVGMKSKEEMKRSKSLAELDLGDAVKGQVQRMLYRLKSGDYERSETPKNRKISLKEMPIKSSVSEKIALFEGKSTSSISVRRERNIETSTVSSRNVPKFLVNKTEAIPEEVYLRKIEDLSTATARYNRSEMLYLSLGNGEQMPAIALGTALLDRRLAPHIVAAAIDLGYRAIDTAYIYGNERDVGQAIKNKIDDGTVKREDLFIMSKLWSTFHDPSLVEQACRASLEAMGLDYFDLYMIHNPMSFKEGSDPIPKIATVVQFSEHDYLDAWFGMEALVSKGLVKSIGLSNFNSQQIQKILDKGRIKPLVNQVECHPYLTQHSLDSFCKDRNITLSCFSVLGSKGTPKEYKSNVSAAIDDPLIKVMASGLNVTAARLLVRYQIQLGRQAVVKSSSAEHLWDVLQALTFVLEQHEIDAISALNRNKRIFTFEGMGHLHKNYPFNIPF